MSAVGKRDNTITGAVGFWLLGESLSDGGEVLGVGRIVWAGQSFSFGLVTNIRELGTEHLSNEGDREVENEIVQIRSHPEDI